MSMGLRLGKGLPLKPKTLNSLFCMETLPEATAKG